MTLACGGHPPPLIRRGSGVIEALRAHGPLLGVFAAAEFPEVTVDLQPEDTVLLYTDGLIERNPRVAGDTALRDLLASLTFADVDELIAQIEARALGTPPVRLPDDAAVLAIQVTAPDAGRRRRGRQGRADAGPRAEGVGGQSGYAGAGTASSGLLEASADAGTMSTHTATEPRRVTPRFRVQCVQAPTATELPRKRRANKKDAPLL